MKTQLVDIYIRTNDTKVIPFKGGDNTDNKQLQIPPEMRTFLEGLLDDAGMNVPPDLKEEMINDLYARLEHKLVAAAAEKLKPEDLEEFQKLLEEKKSQEELQKFLTGRLQNAQEIFAQAISEFRDAYLTNITPAMEKAATETK